MNKEIQALEEKIESYNYDHIANLRKDFILNGFVRIKNFLTTSLLECMNKECTQIVKLRGSDKDFRMIETQNTPRHMRTVSQKMISKDSKYIPAIYNSNIVRIFLSSIAGEPLYKAPWMPEQYVLSNLYRDGDTHGWHWDDYTFASVIYIKSTKVDQGGFVQTCSNGHWDKKNPKVFQTILNAPINTYHCKSGDAYLLRAKDYLHRVTPIQNSGKRMIINMTWASEKDLTTEMTHETNDILFTELTYQSS